MSDKKYLVIERQKYSNIKDTWTIKFADVDENTAFPKMVALRTLNEDRETTSYHLQEVNFNVVEKPLVLTDEVKEEQSEMPF